MRSPLGRYYLYFAHHHGDHIRLAYADSLRGPWTLHVPGTLQLADTPFHDHIASPDVHVRDGEILMYFHGRSQKGEAQTTCLASSADGLRFSTVSGPLGPFYFRVFVHRGWHYAIAKNGNIDGVLLRSPNGRDAFESGPRVIPRMRYTAIQWIDSDSL